MIEQPGGAIVALLGGDSLMGTVGVDGLRLAYEQAGAGPPLVLLHGYVGDGLTTWRHQIEALSSEFTVVVWDTPGMGGSDDPPETFGMAGYADCLAGFLGAIGIEQAHVAGQSFGGALAIELCRRHPGVARTLTLVSAYAGWAGSLAPEVAEQRLQQAHRLASLPASAFVDTLLPTMFSEGTPQESIEGFGASLAAFHPAGFRAMANASAEDLREALPHIRVPTLLIYGDDDVRAPLTVAEALHQAIPGSVLTVLPGTGHVCTIEAPDDVNRALRAFLRRAAA